MYFGRVSLKLVLACFFFEIKLNAMIFFCIFVYISIFVLNILCVALFDEYVTL